MFIFIKIPIFNMKKTYMYLIVVLVILVIAVLGWYYFTSVGNMLCVGGEWCGGGDGGGNYSIPNSCTDSDGGVIPLIKGTVSGYKNNYPYSYTDVCGGNFFLREYYCQGNAYSYTTVSCQISNTTTHCYNGACV